MCDFQDNIEGIVAVIDEGQNPEGNNSQNQFVSEEYWDPAQTKTTQMPPKKNELFDFIKTSS